MSTRKIYRPANISKEAAVAALESAGLTVVALNEVGDDKTGRQFEAEVKVAEFPPSDDKGGDDAGGGNPFASDEPKDDAPKDEDDKSDEPKDDKPAGPPKSDEGDKPKDDGGDKGDIGQLIDLVKQIATHFGIELGDGLPGEGELPPLLDDPMDLPDSGAPIAGEPAMGGDKPLPPPVPEKGGPGGGGGIFASTVEGLEKVASRRTFVATVVDGHLKNDGELVNEGRAHFPGYRVAKIDRSGAGDGFVRVAMIRG